METKWKIEEAIFYLTQAPWGTTLAEDAGTRWLDVTAKSSFLEDTLRFSGIAFPISVSYCKSETIRLGSKFDA
jgi:hypothetical protein